MKQYSFEINIPAESKTEAVVKFLLCQETVNSLTAKEVSILLEVYLVYMANFSEMKKADAVNPDEVSLPSTDNKSASRQG